MSNTFTFRTRYRHHIGRDEHALLWAIRENRRPARHQVWLRYGAVRGMYGSLGRTSGSLLRHGRCHRWRAVRGRTSKGWKATGRPLQAAWIELQVRAMR